MMNTRLQNRLTESEILKVFSDTVEVRSFARADCTTSSPTGRHRRPSHTCTTRTRRSSTVI